MKKKGKSPVIAGRVPESLYRQIKKAAKGSGRSMSDELAWRAGYSFKQEKMKAIQDEVTELHDRFDSVMDNIKELVRQTHALTQTLTKIEHNSWVAAEFANNQFRQKSTGKSEPAPDFGSSPSPH